MCLENLYAQYQTVRPLKDAVQIGFKCNQYQQFGFDEYRFSEWNKYYDSIKIEKSEYYHISNKSVGYNLPDDVDAIIFNASKFDFSHLIFTIGGTNQKVNFATKNDSIVTLFLPKMKFNYKIIANYHDTQIGQLNVFVYSLKTEKIIIVPMINQNLNKDSIQEYLNSVYRQANLQFNVTVAPNYSHKDFNKKVLFDNPSPANDRFTGQMCDFRDAYFESNPNADKKAYYIFIIPGFVNPKLKGYMVLNKAIAFIKKSPDKELYLSITRELAHGIGILKSSWSEGGPTRGTTDNLMDELGGTVLTRFQWESIRHSSHSFSFYDNYEDVRTNNGIVAYYFWEEDKNGNIKLENNDLLGSLKRPYKKNFMSYHLNIGDFFFKILFFVGNFPICFWHILSFVFIYSFAFFFRRKIHRYLKIKFKKTKLWRFTSRILLLVGASFLFYLSFILINSGYGRFEVKSGLLKDLNNTSLKNAVKTILVNKNVKHKAKEQLCSETLIHKGNNWFVRQRKKVLYFNLKQDSKDQWTICRYAADNDSLILDKFDFRDQAQSHYIVFNYLNASGVTENQKVFNHLGIELSSKLKIEDPAKRILIFVNGYRPTSLGQSFEENFKDIQTKGLEFSQSKNLIFNFDRYDYWRPWHAIDVLFQKRINPSEIYYADGHFSVSTSNHESLIDFTAVSSFYPKRCKNKKKHICYITKMNSSGVFGSKTVKTISLHKTKPNKSGFNERVENGRIAGRNLLQLLNELPNKSPNDTIYFVTHSMGHAYSLGMIEILRGKIHFGGIYIIAPENASAGKINLNEWQEVWQYGSNFNPGESDAPCLLDGVAPQIMAGGLKPTNRIYIPKQLYKHKGFFDSHFVGYFTWIFSIKKEESGYIRQR